MRLHYIVQNAAAKATAHDIKKYEDVWTSARQPSEGRDKMSIDNELEDIRTACKDKKRDIKAGRDRVTSSNKLFLLEKFVFWIRAGGLGRYGRTGKVCQSTSTNVDLLFEEATVLIDDFCNFLESHIDIGEVCPGPVKRPDRAFQKAARKYYYDPRHLTDLVRCCILLESITDAKRVLDLIFKMSSVFGEEAPGDAEENETPNEYQEALLGRSRDSNQEPKVFKLCKVKDDFTREGLGYRYICLNLEVGWTIESESGVGLKFVTVKDFDQKHVRMHICEVQLLLRSTYELEIGGCHDNFVKARNMLAQ